MTRIAVIGMALIVLASAGCTDKREIKSLKNTDASLSDEIAFLTMRVKAVEEACLQIHERLNATENHPKTTSQNDEGKTQNQPSIFNPGTDGAKGTEKGSSLSESETPFKLTRGSIGHNLVGMAPERITKLFGKPDQVTETAGNQNWIYNGLPLDMEGGGVEKSPALIVFEQGRVSRAVLTRSARSEASERGEASERAENTQYSPPPEESKTSNTAVPTNQ